MTGIPLTEEEYEESQKALQVFNKLYEDEIENKKEKKIEIVKKQKTIKGFF